MLPDQYQMDLLLHDLISKSTHSGPGNTNCTDKVICVYLTSCLYEFTGHIISMYFPSLNIEKIL